MRDNFFTQSQCDRCGGSLSDGRTMSRFDTSCLCLKCATGERNHPDYRKATDAEMEAVRHGVRNFPGVGWLGEKKRFKPKPEKETWK